MLPAGPPGSIWTYVIALAAVAVVVARNSRLRKLKVERLWLAPVLILAATAATLSHQAPPGPAMLAADAVALLAGAVLGWWRGRFTTIAVDPQTHALTSRASPVGMVLILGILALRMALRGLLAQNASAWHVSAALATDAFLLLAVGIVCAQRLEMAIRANRLLTEARGGHQV